MYNMQLAEILSASKLFFVVPNFGVIPAATLDEQPACLCYKSACPYPGKHPSLNNGFVGASQDEAEIRKWHKATAGKMNIGFRMGDGKCVLDLDPRHGGDNALKQLEGKYGALPTTPRVKTGDGLHFYFTCDQNLDKFDFCQGIEIKANGSRVIAPPSLHFSGRKYVWELAPIGIEAGVEQVPFAEIPSWLLQKDGEKSSLSAARPSKPLASRFVINLPGDFSTCEGVCEGQRHKRLVQYAGRHLGRGEKVDDVLLLATTWASRCSPPLNADEVVNVINGLRKKEERKKPEVDSSFVPPSTKQATPTFFLPAADEETTNIEEKKIEGEGRVVQSKSIILSHEAYHGLFGEILEAIEPETEADIGGILLCLLTTFGNAVGSNPHTQAGPDKHGANLFTLLIGETASRKGAAESTVSWLMEKADPEWASKCIIHGLGTGEGLAEKLEDEAFEKDENGNLVLNQCASEKRLLAVEREFASLMKRAQREGNTLSDVIRNAWDGKPLEVVNRKKNSLKATDHHVSMIGNITPKELEMCLKKGTEAVNGFLNRFLLAFVHRSKKLPSGGNIEILKPFIEPLSAAIEKAKDIGLVKRSPDAEKSWAERYCSRQEAQGIAGDFTARAEAQTLRLSLIYAVADGAEVIEVSHLKAALAVWSFAEASAMALFGDGTTPPPPLSKKLLDAIRIKPGILRTELWDVVGRNITKAEIEEALKNLETSNLVYREKVKTGGRDGEAWFERKKKEEEKALSTSDNEAAKEVDASSFVHSFASSHEEAQDGLPFSFVPSTSENETSRHGGEEKGVVPSYAKVTITEITLPGNSRLEAHADDEADDNFKRGQSPKPAPSSLEAVAEDELLNDEDFLAKLKSIGEPDEAKWFQRDENGRLI